MSRLVVILFGPSGAGKTTIARASNLTVYDRDDPHWRGRTEADFVRSIKQLAYNPAGRAVIIRAGATSSARHRAITQTQATHAYLVDASAAECHYRAGHRRRADAKRSHSYIDSWFTRHDRDDGIATWPGSWELALTEPIQLPPLTPTRACTRADTRSKAGDPRGTQAWKRLRARVYAEETHCCLCGGWVDQSLPRNHPMSRTAHHLDALASGGKGVPDRSRVRLAHWSCNSALGDRTDPVERSLTVTLDSI